MLRQLSAIACVLFLGASLSYGRGGKQTAASPKSSEVIGHGNIPVELTRALDSSKLTQGQAVEAKTSGEFVLPGGVKVPRGSKVTGHVAEAKSRANGDSQSDLTIVFDSIILPGQAEQPLKGSIQAVGPKQEDTSGPDDPMVSHQAGSGTGAPPSMTSGSNTQTLGSPAREVLNPQSTGVRGIHNLDLSPEGVLTSKGKSVKLDSGDRLIVHVDLFKP